MGLDHRRQGEGEGGGEDGVEAGGEDESTQSSLLEGVGKEMTHLLGGGEGEDEGEGEGEGGGLQQTRVVTEEGRTARVHPAQVQLWSLGGRRRWSCCVCSCSLDCQR